MDYIVLISSSIILYAYGGYYLVLRVAYIFWSERDRQKEIATLPKVTVLLTVFNEEKKILGRLKNILDSTYPEHLLRIVVASDGSTDSTDEKVKSLANPNISLVRPTEREGKTETQNYALQFIEGGIVVITDADTIFDTDCIINLVAPFFDPRVGGVDGHLLFSSDINSAVAESQGLYWKQELQLRKFESALGFLAVSSGPVLAVRRDLIPKMVSTVGEDCLLPLEVVSRGFLMKHQETALAYDRMDDDVREELRTRTRMTQRNWQGTWMYPQLLNPFKNFKIAMGLWSHKLLRWLSPVFLITWVFASFFIVTQTSSENTWFVAELLAYLGVCFFILGIAGALSDLIGRKHVGLSFVWAFWLANLGFLLGIRNAMLGNKIKAYR